MCPQAPPPGAGDSRRPRNVDKTGQDKTRHYEVPPPAHRPDLCLYFSVSDGYVLNREFSFPVSENHTHNPTNSADALPGIFVYKQRAIPDADPVAYCADCLNYASRINDMITRGPDVRGNKQFFRYACDWSCRNHLLTTGRCLKYRRGFLDRSDKYMFEVEDPPLACRGIRACP